MGARVRGIGAAITALTLDQASKAIVVANAATLREGVSISSGFNLLFLHNEGVTFGLLTGIHSWVLVLLASGVVIFLTALMLRAKRTAETVAYGTVVGGALGNIVDRIRYGGVTDFMDFYIGTSHWPAFNLADVFVICGVGWLLIVGARDASTSARAPH